MSKSNVLNNNKRYSMLSVGDKSIFKETTKKVTNPNNKEKVTNPKEKVTNPNNKENVTNLNNKEKVTNSTKFKAINLNKIQKKFFSTTKATGNYVKDTFIAVDPLITGYKNNENYNKLLNRFEIKNYNNNEITIEEEDGYEISSDKVSTIVTSIFNDKSLKNRKDDEIVKGYHKLFNFSKEMDKHIEKIKLDIKKYNNLEVQNKKYYEKIRGYLEVIKKKDSHDNAHYQKKLFTSTLAKDHNVKKREQSVKYAKFYLYKIFQNLYEIIKIKTNIKINMSIIKKLWNQRGNEIIEEYFKKINSNLEIYIEKYEKYIGDYEEMRVMIQTKNKEKKIPNVNNY